MKYFYDSEFLEDGKTIDLISIAFVAEDGREYYAVNADADWERIDGDEWLRDNVVAQLPEYPNRWKPKAQIAAEVLEFLTTEKGIPELWAWYSAYDHVVYAQLWGKMIHLPHGLPMHTNELKTLLHEKMPRVQDRNGFPAQADGLHDALADARHVKVRYDWIMEQALLKKEAEIRRIKAEALREAADAACEKGTGMDGAEARERENRGFMQRHNVRSAARWLQHQADVLERAAK